MRIMIADLILTAEQKQRINELKNSENIVGLSGGKDSMATCILLSYFEIPYKTVTSEVWWKEGMTGENPYHYEFFHSKAIPKLNNWGIQTDLIRSKKTAYEFITTPISRSEYPERIGKLRGFPLCGKCGIQRDCKLRPCNSYYKKQPPDKNVITGLAANEKTRNVSNKKAGRISFLELLGIFEYQTYEICAKEGLLSPTYTFSDRGGCWFCPNQKIQELELLYREFPELWNELMIIQQMPKKVTELFNRTQTLYDIEAQIKAGVQMKFFSGQFFL